LVVVYSGMHKKGQKKWLDEIICSWFSTKNLYRDKKKIVVIDEI